ncbi:MAG: hypothetical protein ACLRVB_07955 [Blautia sp.]
MGEQVEQKNKVLTFWVLNKKKYLSFRPHSGYEAVIEETAEEMWKLIHQYIEEGYQIL